MTKKSGLAAELKGMGSVLVAFSGGVDSAFLLAAASEALGKNVLAVTAVSPIHPFRERAEATAFTQKRGIAHLLISSRECDIPEFIANNPDRCYHCKKALCKSLNKIAQDKGIRHVIHGANVDDLKDFRPGFQAALEEGVKAPLMDNNLGKAEIRHLAKKMGLPQWNRPSAACLASRLPYGSLITEKKLKMIERAEAFLQDNGLKTFRVRHHGTIARIEVGGSERDLILEDAVRKDVIAKFRQLGFDHIALDLEDFTSGNMNRSLHRGKNESLTEISQKGGKR